MPRPPADTDTTKRTPPGTIVIPGTSLPFQFNLRMGLKTERDRNLRCSSLENFQVSTLSACNAGFVPPYLEDVKASLKSAGTIGDRVHVNIDYDMQREFDASQTVSLYYQGPAGSKLQRIDVGNINFVPPSSRFLTSALPSGNYGAQITNQFGRLTLKTIFAKQIGNVVQDRVFNIGARAQQAVDRETDDYQIERLRFFFTVDPALFRGVYPNVDILNRRQLSFLRNTLPDTLRPTRVLLYRLQYGTQPQNANGPRFRLQGDPTRGTQTYDLLREGVDYYMDPSLLWFALVRPLNETNERLVVAYNVRINGRDTTWVNSGGTPDLQYVPGRDQVANLVMDPTVGPSSPAFRNEIRSVYRIAGEDLVRQSTKVRIVTGSGLLEHPLTGGDATFLQMFGLAAPTSPAEFDYDNRLWPRPSDGVFNLGAGAADVRSGNAQALDIAKIIRDYFLVFPSLHPFSARDSGLVVPGNPTNNAIYTIPGEYLYSPQHPASIYRLHLQYQTAGTDEFGAITLGATQMRPGSERVLLDGRPLVRDLDYRINYDLGQVEFLRPDTLFTLDRRVEVSYEENPVFGGSPTTLAGFTSELPVSHGTLDFTAITQQQQTSFTRPQLGFQGNATLTAGVTGRFNWDVPLLTRFANSLPFGATKTPSHLSLQAELASSKPQFGLGAGQTEAYLETFEADGGRAISMADESWYYSSLPAYGNTLRSTYGAAFFEPAHAATLAWQTNVATPGGNRVFFTRKQIDPLIDFTGSGFEAPEPVLWLSLLPQNQVGRYDRATKSYQWMLPLTPNGQRFRSIRTVLSPSGIDLTNGELLEFWTLLDTSTVARRANPSVVFDFGDVSENSLSFAPETLTVRHNANGTVDSLYTGRKLAGFDSLDTERDPFSHAFNTDVNDTGLPGDVVDTLVVIDGGTVKRVFNQRICRATPGSIDVLGDPHTNCTVANNRLDEEDIDQDNALNFPNALRDRERLLRYVVDLSDPAKYKRVGGSYTDTLFVQGAAQVRTRQWVLISIPFKTPTDSLNDVNRRKLRALRMTLVSNRLDNQDATVQLPIAELRVTGAPWLDRSNQTLAGIGGIRPDGGFVVSSTISTTDSSGALVYQPPPGVTNQADSKVAQFSGSLTQINESSMRIQAGNMPLYHRAEAYSRFPNGPQYFLGYKDLRVWGRGRGDGWGQNGDLQMYIKVGRDENNFYLYRTPIASGQTPAAWTDIDVAFDRFVALRAQIQADYLKGKKESIACTGVDSAIIAATPIPSGIVAHRFAACADGYMAYTLDPAVTAPNLAAVQELAVGIVRVAANSQSTFAPSDTLELWVDDIRLEHQVNTTGYAGQVTAALNIGDFADMRVGVSNRDPNFRQLGEQPNFLGQRDVDVALTTHLEKLLPKSVGLALPLTITKVSLGTEPLYLTQSDIAASATPGLRKPKNDLTTYTLSVRRTTPLDAGPLGTLFNNLSATSSYVTGVDRTEYQDGTSRNLDVALDYIVTSDSARTATLPSWVDGALGALPGALKAGPIGALRSSAFRWNPTQLRITSGFVRGDDRTVSFLQPTGFSTDAPTTSGASSRLWRNASVLELRPTNGLSARWEIASVRDFRDYRDTSALGVLPGGLQQSSVNIAPGFERERTLATNFTFAPSFSSWFAPRADLGTQYDMLRDPNVRTFSALPGVIGVDSVLATNDSTSALGLPRRMTAAQTASVGATINVASAVKAYTRDSSTIRRLGGIFAPLDLSYTRSLLSTIDEANVGAPLLYQFGLGGPSTFRSVHGVDATTAGQTGTLDATSTLLLPLGTSIVNRYRRTTTLNWISRPDTTQAHVDGSQTQFPDATVRWAYRPSAASGPVSSFEANVGFTRALATVSLPSLFTDDPPEIRRTHSDQFPIGATINWAERGSLSTAIRYAYRRQLDSLPGSLARSRGDEISFDAGRAFRVPASWGLGLKNDIRTRFNFQNSHNTTVIFDELGTLQSRLQDNGRQAFNLTADTNVLDNAIFTFQGSHTIIFDNNLNRRFAQTVISAVLQFQFFGTSR